MPYPRYLRSHPCGDRRRVRRRANQRAVLALPWRLAPGSASLFIRSEQYVLVSGQPYFQSGGHRPGFSPALARRPIHRPCGGGFKLTPKNRKRLPGFPCCPSPSSVGACRMNWDRTRAHEGAGKRANRAERRRTTPTACHSLHYLGKKTANESVRFGQARKGVHT